MIIFLKAGKKKQSLGHTPSSPRIFYALGRFIITLKQWDQQASYNPVIFTSEDNALSWNEITEYTATLSAQDKIKYIDIGPDNQDYFSFELENASGGTSFVAIGSKDFIGKPLHAHASHEIVALAGDNENGWVAIASDGHSYIGTPKASVIAAARKNE